MDMRGCGGYEGVWWIQGCLVDMRGCGGYEGVWWI